MLLGVVDAEWLEKAKNRANSLNDSIYRVHTDTEPFWGAMLMALLFEFPERLLKGAPNMPENYLLLSDEVAGRSDATSDRLEELKSALKDVLNKSCDRKVRQVLAAEKQANKPWYAIFEQDDDLMNAIKKDNSDDSLNGLLFALTKDEDAKEVVQENCHPPF